uniref:peptidylprolyl isomerase n=1 Tax=Albugo laibachii Nc14 TaxID=890382 RepID=F0WMK3_9STRA|nr:FKBPtype peptidylprolyl cistrans isomerase putative [Albugo laibachii Nc14]|eukprot:CCA22535.1 FKBPtype peptidylprolyl cistrans isomerase putative [Albugo laibachii Nc14]
MGGYMGSEANDSEFEDVLGSGGIHRKILVPSEGIAADFGERVTVRFSEYRKNDNSIISAPQERTFRIGDGEVYPALELIAKLMRIGEIDDVHCDGRFAYGDKGWEDGNVEPNTPLRLSIELLCVDKRPISEMNSTELMEEAMKKKESGNRYHNQKKYEHAEKMYKRALKLMESWENTEKEEKACKKLLIALGNNLGNVQHKLGNGKEARKSCMEVLEVDPENIKAMHRLAQIAISESEFDEARIIIKKALLSDPTNRIFRDLVNVLAEKKKKYKEMEKSLYKKWSGDDKNEADLDTTEVVDAPPHSSNTLMIFTTLITCVLAVLMTQFSGEITSWLNG